MVITQIILFFEVTYKNISVNHVILTAAKPGRHVVFLFPASGKDKEVTE